MAGAFTTIDLSKLPPPSVLEPLNYELILQELLADFHQRMDAAGDPFTALVESDPAYKLAETFAYRELLLRERVNNACRAVMIAYASGADLDNIGANFGVARLLITPADDSTIPPTPAVWETDDEFRQRIPLSLEGYTTAGSEGSYVYHALSADGQVRDAMAVSPAPGDVSVYVLSRDGSGMAGESLLATVATALNAEYVRPMTDRVTVLSASIVEYAVQAELVMYPGPDASTVLESAREALTAYTDSVHRIGHDISVSGIYQALHQPGVQRVNLISPTSNIVIDDGQAAWCSGVTLNLAGETNV